MSEAEWLATTDSGSILTFLAHGPQWAMELGKRTEGALQ
jgi:hypothetical protein